METTSSGFKAANINMKLLLWMIKIGITSLFQIMDN